MCRIYASVNWVSIGSDNGLSPIRKYTYRGYLDVKARTGRECQMACQSRFNIRKLYSNTRRRFLLQIASVVTGTWELLNINMWLSVNARKPWWRHEIETFSALLALSAGNSAVIGEFPAQRPVTRSFDVFFDLRLNKRLSKHSWGSWFETPSRSSWHHCNASKFWQMDGKGPSHVSLQLRDTGMLRTKSCFTIVYCTDTVYMANIANQMCIISANVYPWNYKTTHENNKKKYTYKVAYVLFYMLNRCTLLISLQINRYGWYRSKRSLHKGSGLTWIQWNLSITTT